MDDERVIYLIESAVEFKADPEYGIAADYAISCIETLRLIRGAVTHGVDPVELKWSLIQLFECNYTTSLKKLAGEE